MRTALLVCLALALVACVSCAPKPTTPEGPVTPRPAKVVPKATTTTPTAPKAQTKSESAPATGSEAAALPIGNTKNAQGQYMCPVMDNPIKDISKAEHVVYKGKTYYFCCAGCPADFQKDPEKYLKPGGAKN